MGRSGGWGWRMAAVYAMAVAAALPAQGRDASGSSAPSDVHTLHRWILANNDHHGRPFAIVDKQAARLVVFTAGGQLIGAAPALIGQQRGDTALPGAGRVEPDSLPPDARITPAGRYASEPGRNLQDEAIVWFDYDARLAIHRLRPAPASQRRPQRLASATPDDNRISLGCVVVTGDFYDQVVAPTLGRARGVVYVLPDTLPLHRVFGPSVAAPLQAL